MTEDEARAWVGARFPEAVDHISAFVAMVRAENDRQNLIAPSTLNQIWSRHVVDSLQLLRYGSVTGRWVDIGTGGGFPGLVVALVREGPTMLIEPRTKRATFLTKCVQDLGAANVEVVQSRAEVVTTTAATISARAVSSLDSLFHLGKPWALDATKWILPRGRLTNENMQTLADRFGPMFHVEHSVTSVESMIVIATGWPR